MMGETVMSQAVKANTMGFNDFLTEGLVEYVDVNEENNSLIALYEVHHHHHHHHMCLVAV